MSDAVQRAAPVTASRDLPTESERVYVWDAVVRTTHWLMFTAIMVLSVTGYYIGRPFAGGAGPSTSAFTMAWFKTVHFYAAIVFMAAVVARLAWTIGGPKYARWNQFLPVSAERWRNIRDTFLFYIMVRRRPPAYPGHNGLAGATYVAVYGLYALVIASGLALYSVDASVASYTHHFRFLLALFGGAANARWVHHVIMWLLLGFMVHHFYSALLVSMAEKNGTLDSIFSGFKFLPKEGEEKEGEHHDG